MNTRPDLVFVVGYVSHFLEEPREDHLAAVIAAVKKILRYVAVPTIGGFGSAGRKETRCC
jgi:hypothetical protein